MVRVFIIGHSCHDSRRSGCSHHSGQAWQYANENLRRNVETFLAVFTREGSPQSTVLGSEKQAEAAEALKVSGELVQTPLQRLDNILQPWVAFGVMPLFALANAGIELNKGDVGAMLAEAVPMGIMLGLLIGKQVGITLFTWLAVRHRPRGAA